MASAAMGARVVGTVTADVEFTVGARESGPAAACAAWTSVQALAPCKDTGHKSAIAWEFLGAGRGALPIPKVSSGPSASMQVTSTDRAHYRENSAGLGAWFKG